MVAYRYAALAATFASVQAAFKGFNAGSTNIDGSVRNQADFESEFRAGAGLPRTNGEWTSARLYTMIQGGTTNDVISAIPAAISTDTSLLLGLWGSAGDEAFSQELTALRGAISQYGSQLAQRAIGISVGSEDLYRITPTGIANDAGVGAGPDVISRYISQVREVLQGGPLANVPVGHVDTWTAWVNGSNSAVIEASDFLGVDGYPYFQTDSGDNSIDNGRQLFFDSYDATVGVSGGTPVWVTETGWPVSGPNVGQAVASVRNARQYWVDVQCTLAEMNINTFWFTLEDTNSADAASFGILENGYGSAPQYDLSCPAGGSNSTSSSSVRASSTRAPSSSRTPSSSMRASATGGGFGSFPTESPSETSISLPSSAASAPVFSAPVMSGPAVPSTTQASAPTGVPAALPSGMTTATAATTPTSAPAASASPFTGSASTLAGQSAFAFAAAAAAVALYL